jgi:hypothetical protein
MGMNFTDQDRPFVEQRLKEWGAKIVNISAPPDTPNVKTVLCDKADYRAIIDHATKDPEFEITQDVIDTADAIWKGRPATDKTKSY